MLIINQLYKQFPQTYAPALRGIDLHLRPGDFCILIGSNGSGKSTLLKTLTGEYSADAGDLFIEGKSLGPLGLTERAGLISAVSQDVSAGTAPQMTLLENAVLSLMRGKRAQLRLIQRDRSAVEEAIAELGLGLEAYLNKPLMALSGGQRQMVATALAFMGEPKLMLLDEHTSALDPKTQKMLMEYTARTIQHKKVTTLMITHNLEDAARYGNRLLMMHQGQIVLDVRDDEKAQLSAQDLLERFHTYEDQLLVGPNGGSVR